MATLACPGPPSCPYHPALCSPAALQGLTVLEFLLRHGSEQCVAQARSGAVAARLESLAASFHYVAPDGRDMGVNVRHRCV